MRHRFYVPHAALYVPAPGGGGASLAAQDLGGDTGFAANFLDDFFFASQTKYGSAKVSSPSFDGAPIDLFTYTSPSNKRLQAANGSMYTASGGALPFEWQGGVLKGLRVEPQATNIIQRSAELNQTNPWNRFNVAVTEDAAVGPDGNTVAEKIADANTNNNRHILFSNAVTVTSSVRYCHSVFAKADDKSFAALAISSNSVRYGRVFDLINGTLGDDTTVGSPTGTGAGIEAWGNGWYRCWITMVAENTAIGVDIGLSNSATPSFNTAMPIYVGVTGEGVYAWGAQVEAGEFPSSYIPTTSGAVTRNADVVGPPLADFPWNSGSGTYTVDGVSESPADNGTLLTLARRTGQLHIESVKWTVP